MMNSKFTVRVYGILVNDKKQVLITDEIYQGKQLTKFPGGGLEYGEGTIDCLRRECREEMGREIEIIDHFYTTDFFQPSIFNKDVQVICIYYRIDIDHCDQLKTSLKKFDFPEIKDGTVVFRWAKIDSFLHEEFTFENDRRVGGMLFSQIIL